MSKTTSRGRKIGCGVVVSLLIGTIGFLSDVLDLSERFSPQPTPTSTTAAVGPVEAVDVLGIKFGRRWAYSLEERTEDYGGETPEASFNLNTQIFSEEVVFLVPLSGGISIAPSCWQSKEIEAHQGNASAGAGHREASMWIGVV